MNGLLEYPQYTRPEVWQEMPVPEVLLTGHHANIQKWREEQSLPPHQRKTTGSFGKADRNGNKAFAKMLISHCVKHTNMLITFI